MTWTIVGLGNPGHRYEQTRHNAGFVFLDLLAGQLGISFAQGEGQWMVAETGGISLVKPLTFMNASGEIFLHSAFRPDGDHGVLVVVDTMDLPPGALRLKKRGGTAGHNGLKSVHAHIGASFIPLYVGIGRPAEGVSVIDHVLGPFGDDEWSLLQDALRHAADCLPLIMAGDMDAALQEVNSWRSGTDS